MQLLVRVGCGCGLRAIDYRLNRYAIHDSRSPPKFKPAPEVREEFCGNTTRVSCLHVYHLRCLTWGVSSFCESTSTMACVLTASTPIGSSVSSTSVFYNRTCIYSAPSTRKSHAREITLFDASLSIRPLNLSMVAPATVPHSFFPTIFLPDGMIYRRLNLTHNRDQCWIRDLDNGPSPPLSDCELLSPIYVGGVL